MAKLTEEIKAGWMEQIASRVAIINDRINELLVKIEQNDQGESITLNKHRLKDYQKDRAKWSDHKDALKLKPIGSNITPSELFFMAYGDSRNIMTPDLVAKGILNENTYYQIEAGTDFEHKPMAGVNVEILNADGKIDRDDARSKLFHGPYPIDQCREYVKELRQR